MAICRDVFGVSSQTVYTKTLQRQTAFTALSPLRRTQRESSFRTVLLISGTLWVLLLVARQTTWLFSSRVRFSLFFFFFFFFLVLFFLGSFFFFFFLVSFSFLVLFFFVFFLGVSLSNAFFFFWFLRNGSLCRYLPSVPQGSGSLTNARARILSQLQQWLQN